MAPHASSTLVKPAPIDASESAIESTLDVLELTSFGPGIFTNKRPLWHPPGARGIYGGGVIAQSLTVAQKTVSDDFTVHSMHCYFVLAGASDVPIIYHVEHVRDGVSFATRTVQARQRGKCIFTTTMSFMKEIRAGRDMVQHAVAMPMDVVKPANRLQASEMRDMGPFVGISAEIVRGEGVKPDEVKTRGWYKAKGEISAKGGHQAHLSALAYISDSGFMVAALVANDLGDINKTFGDKDVLSERTRRDIGMMVSLDHIIYFHAPRKFRADEWIFIERTSPWTGDERGLVLQHMFASDGTLLATCIQEGVIRLRDSKPKL